MPNMLVILVFLFLCEGLGFMVRRIYKFFSENSIHSKFKLVNHDVAAGKKGIFIRSNMTTVTGLEVFHRVSYC